MTANGPSDHSIVDDDMHVIWALGQEEGMYHHAPASGLEAETPSIPDFYRPDELKYHGRRNRGTTSLNFYEEEKRDLNDGTDLTYCGNEFKYPTSCSRKVTYRAFHIFFPLGLSTIEYLLPSKGSDTLNYRF